MIKYQVFRNINQLNDELASGIKWEVVAVSWVDVDVEIEDDDTGEKKIKTYHNPVLLMVRNIED